MARQVFRTWEDYFIPGTSVLRNKFTTPGNPYGEPDAVKLRFLEEGYASSRILELAQTPIQGNFDYAHMKAIHHHIFQDVYEWAGQERVAPLGTFMVKSGPDVVHYPLGDPTAPQMSYQYYPAGPVLGQAANEQYRRLSKMDLLRGLDHETFVAELAEIWGELNVIHSFREGIHARSLCFSPSCLSKPVGSLILRFLRRAPLPAMNRQPPLAINQAHPPVTDQAPPPARNS